MKIKLLRCLLITFISLFLVSCVPGKDKIVKSIEETLNNRYGETFIVDSIGGRNLEDREIKALAYPNNDKDKLFKVYVSDDLQTIKDDYKVILVQDRINSIVEELSKPIFGEVFIDCKVWGEASASNISYTDYSNYFEETLYSGMGVNIYVNCSSEVDKYKESNKILDFMNSYRNFNYPTQYINVYYVKSDVFSNIDSEFRTLDNEHRYYSSKENSYSLFMTPLENIYYRIDFSEWTDINKILENFRL